MGTLLIAFVVLNLMFRTILPSLAYSGRACLPSSSLVRKLLGRKIACILQTWKVRDERSALPKARKRVIRKGDRMCFYAPALQENAYGSVEFNERYVQ